jgi:tellurite resistance protein TehA-like permease
MIALVAMLAPHVSMWQLACCHACCLRLKRNGCAITQNTLVHNLQVGDWIATRKDIEHINAAWLILPVGNFVAALVGPGLDQAYVPAMQFWFAFALMLWVLLFAITFAKAIIMTDNGECPVCCCIGCDACCC